MNKRLINVVEALVPPTNDSIMVVIGNRFRCWAGNLVRTAFNWVGVNLQHNRPYLEGPIQVLYYGVANDNPLLQLSHGLHIQDLPTHTDTRIHPSKSTYHHKKHYYGIVGKYKCPFLSSLSL